MTAVITPGSRPRLAQSSSSLSGASQAWNPARAWVSSPQPSPLLLLGVSLHEASRCDLPQASASNKDLDTSQSPGARLLIPPPCGHLQKEPAGPGMGAGSVPAPGVEESSQRGCWQPAAPGQRLQERGKVYF